jgi:ribose transport system substrate-binding protein
MKSVSHLFVLFCLALVLFAGCKTSQQEGQKSYKLAFLTNTAANFWTIARKGCEKADAELQDVEVEFKIPSDGTAAEQKRIVDDLLARGIDGLAISPVDPANQTQFLNEIASQVVVFTQDSDAPQSNRACYIGTDNRAAGRQAGELIKEALPEGGKVMLFVGKLDAQNAQERYQGIKEIIEGSNIQILDVLTDNTDTVRAKANAVEALVSHPDLKCMVGLWSYNGPAILNAVTDAGKAGVVKIIAFDEEEAVLNGIRDGNIYATVVQQPFEFGYRAIQMMQKYLHGDRSVIPQNKQLHIPTLVIKKAQVDEFEARLNELRKS